jgi:hypothetical protein
MMNKREKLMFDCKDAAIRELVAWIEECGEATGRTQPMLDRAQDALTGLRVPPGSVMQYYGKTPPEGWEWWTGAPTVNEFGVAFDRPIWIIRKGDLSFPKGKPLIDVLTEGPR